MQYSQEHLKTMVYAEFGGQTECIMGNWKIENFQNKVEVFGTRKWPREKDVFSVIDKGGLEEKIRVLPTGVEPATFWLRLFKRWIPLSIVSKKCKEKQLRYPVDSDLSSG